MVIKTLKFVQKKSTPNQMCLQFLGQSYHGYIQVWLSVITAHILFCTKIEEPGISFIATINQKRVQTYIFYYFRNLTISRTCK